MNSADLENLIARMPDTFRSYRGDRTLEEVECIVPDFVGMSRGKSMQAHKWVKDTTSFLPVSIFYQTLTGKYVSMDIQDQWTESDMALRADLSTACAVPWVEEVTVQIINDLETRDGEPVGLSPRNVLKRVLGFYHRQGWSPIVAPELEFYLTKPNIDPNEPIEPPIGRSGRRSASRQAYSMVAVDEFGAVIDTIYDYAEAQGIELDTVIQEGGAGQVEINLQHGDPLKLADQVFYFKRSIREAALANNKFATFMAKPMRDQPGSAMHIHQSIVNTESGRNIFSDESGKPTDAFYHFIGGAQDHLRSAVPLFAPYVNSYRRFQGGGSAPTNIEWAEDNRSTGLRIPISAPEARRVENRVIGMDCNPYLAIATSLACGYLGMMNEIKPYEAKAGEAFRDGTLLPRNLDDALEAFDEARELRSVLGEEFCSVYGAIKQAELEEFHSEVSTWERKHLMVSV
jgi:glutamine synthetase